MKSLDTYVDSINFDSNFDIVNSLMNVDKIKTSITLWGTKQISIEGFKGAVDIDVITKKIMEAGIKRENQDDLSLKERVEGIEILHKLNYIYDLFSRFDSNFLKNCREAICDANPIKASGIDVLNSAEMHFMSFSREKFIQEFGNSFDEKGIHPEGEIYLSDRICPRFMTLRDHYFNSFM